MSAVRDKPDLGFSAFAHAAFSRRCSSTPCAVQRTSPVRSFGGRKLIYLKPSTRCALFQQSRRVNLLPLAATTLIQAHSSPLTAEVLTNLNFRSLNEGGFKIEQLSTFVFLAVLLAIPFFLGRSFYRALATRKRIEQDARELNYTQARIIGFTEQPAYSEDCNKHSAVVEYETSGNEVVWAETQPAYKDRHELGATVEIMWQPERPRQAHILPYKEFSTAVVGFGKIIEVVLSLVGICFLFGVTIHFHGFAMHIIGPLLIMLGIGFGFGHLTKGRRTYAEKVDVAGYQRRCDRLIQAQERGVVPCHLKW